ncbi:MAG: hypothetical protein JWQ96_1963 [Segetibacter sp.]|nr:hypothetical protein [Segetibacter sp.]
MRKIFVIAILLYSTSVFSQQKNLYGVGLVTPGTGQLHLFETSWKAHIAKFHNGESKRQVFEIITGDHAGTFQLVEGPFAFADMDKEKANAKVHDADILSTISNKLAVDMQGYTFRHLDTLSYNKGPQADKYVQTNYHIKPGKLQDFLRETKRGVMINEQIKSPASYNYYLLMFAGSKQMVVLRRALKDGFKELETGYLPSTTEAFKSAYIKEFGQAEYDKRTAPGAIYEYVDGFETFLLKSRKDLSSVAEKATAQK